jgi:hypothetical protein
LLTIIEPIPKATDEKIKASFGNGTLSRNSFFPLPTQIRLLTPETENGPTSSPRSSSSVTNSKEQQSKTSVPVPLKARLNADHNLEMTMQLGAGQERELIVKWEAEFPANEKLELQEKWEK